MAELERPFRLLFAVARPLTARHWRCRLTFEGVAEEDLPGVWQAVREILRRQCNAWAFSDGESLSFRLTEPHPPLESLPDLLRPSLPSGAQAALQIDEGVQEELQYFSDWEEIGAVLDVLRRVDRSIEITAEIAVTPQKLARRLSEGVDALVLLCHGDCDGGLYLEGRAGRAHRLSPVRFQDLLAERRPFLLLGSCHGERAVEALGESCLNGAIAVSGEHPIEAWAVSVFARMFVELALEGAAGLEEAFAQAREAVRWDGRVGEEVLPDGVNGRPSPWRRFLLLRQGDLPKVAPGASRLQGTPTTAYRRDPRGIPPLPADLFVLRPVQVVEVLAELLPAPEGTGHRLVVLSGPGGMGKTTLSRTVCEELSRRGFFPQGITEVACHGVTSVEQLVPLLLDRLGQAAAPGSLQEQEDLLVMFLGGSTEPGRALLFLDNVDPLLGLLEGPDMGVSRDSTVREPFLRFLGRLLDAAPGLHILATCRERFDDPLARDLPVEPPSRKLAGRILLKAIPASSPARSKVAALLQQGEEGLRVLDPIFELTGRMPLYLLLAGRYLGQRGESLESVIQALQGDVFAVLSQPALAHLRPDQRQAYACVEVSYRLLSEPARITWARLALFPGGFWIQWKELAEVPLPAGWEEHLREAERIGLALFDEENLRYTLPYPFRQFALQKLHAEEAPGESGLARAASAAVQFWTGVSDLWRYELREGASAEEVRAIQRIFLAEEENLVSAVEVGWRFSIPGTGALLEQLFVPLDLLARTRTQAFLADQAAAACQGEPAEQARWLTKSGSAWAKLDHPGAALDRYHRAWAIQASFPPEDLVVRADLAATANNIGNLLLRLGEKEEARGYFERALEIEEALAFPEATFPQLLDLISTYNNLANILDEPGQEGRAEELYGRSLHILRQLSQVFPLLSLPRLATTCNNWASFRVLRRDYDGACALFEEAIESYRRLVREYGEAFLPDVAMACSNYGTVLTQMGRRGKAYELLREALLIRRSLVEQAEQPLAYLPALAATCHNLANLLLDMEDWRQAIRLYGEALKIRRYLASLYPKAYLQNLAETLSNLGIAFRRLHRFSEARQYLEEALRIRRELAQDASVLSRLEVIKTGMNLGLVLHDLKEFAESRKLYEEILGILQELSAQYPSVGLHELAGVSHNLGILLQDLKELPEARGHLERAVEIYKQLYAEAPRLYLAEFIWPLRHLWSCLWELGLQEEAKSLESLMRELDRQEAGWSAEAEAEHAPAASS